jgi:hypothetical protein
MRADDVVTICLVTVTSNSEDHAAPEFNRC